MRASNSPKLINPLSIIFLFFSFTEVMLGYVVFKTAGGIQIALTTFVVIFPAAVATAFFVFLWSKPEHLYAPKDFTTDDAYLQNMAAARTRRDESMSIDRTIRDVVVDELTSDNLVEQLTDTPKVEIREVLRRAARELSARIQEQQSFTVTFGPFDPQLPDMTFPLQTYRTVSELTNDLYYVLSPRVRPYYYGVDWVLRNTESGELIRTKRMLVDAPPGKKLPDNRPLAAVGIRAGARLEVIRPEL